MKGEGVHYAQRKVRRFWYVVKPGRRVLHMVYKSRYNPVEGDKAACGLYVQKGWLFGATASSLVGARRCLRCERAA